MYYRVFNVVDHEYNGYFFVPLILKLDSGSRRLILKFFQFFKIDMFYILFNVVHHEFDATFFI